MPVDLNSLPFFMRTLSDSGDNKKECEHDHTGQGTVVTDALKMVIERERVDVVMAVGPIPMMKAVSNLTKEYDLETHVSLNPVMVDGTGMCGGCRVLVGGESKFACVDGPVFDGHQVDFDDLAHRNKRFVREEQQALKDYEGHQCRIGLQ